MTTYVTPINETPMQKRIAFGHESRTGHKLDAVQVSDDGMLWHTVRMCCGDTVPDHAVTWEKFMATK